SARLARARERMADGASVATLDDRGSPARPRVGPPTGARAERAADGRRRARSRVARAPPDAGSSGALGGARRSLPRVLQRRSARPKRPHHLDAPLGALSRRDPKDAPPQRGARG